MKIEEKTWLEGFIRIETRKDRKKDKKETQKDKYGISW